MPERKEHFYETIPGFFNFEAFYSEAARSMPERSWAAEVGVWQGRSLFYLAVELHNLQKHVTIHAIDSGLNLRFIEELSKWKSEYVHITPGESTSLQAAAAIRTIGLRFDFVFLDADHEYDSIKADIRAWKPCLTPTGLLAGHDWCPAFPGVERAVREEISADRLVIPTVDGVWQQSPNGGPRV